VREKDFIWSELSAYDIFFAIMKCEILFCTLMLSSVSCVLCILCHKYACCLHVGDEKTSICELTNVPSLKYECRAGNICRDELNEKKLFASHLLSRIVVEKHENEYRNCFMSIFSKIMIWIFEFGNFCHDIVYSLPYLKIKKF
jgi:hypothetical protein